MRILVLLAASALIWTAAAAPPPPQGASPADWNVIWRLPQRYAAAWNAQDARALAAMYAQEGEVFDSKGQRATGREQVMNYYEELQRTDAGRKAVTGGWQLLSFMRADIAVGQVALRARVDGSDAPGAVVTGLAVVASKHGSEWLIDSLHELGGGATLSPQERFDTPVTPRKDENPVARGTDEPAI